MLQLDGFTLLAALKLSAQQIDRMQRELAGMKEGTGKVQVQKGKVFQ